MSQLPFSHTPSTTTLDRDACLLKTLPRRGVPKAPVGKQVPRSLRQDHRKDRREEDPETVCAGVRYVPREAGGDL